MVLSCCTAEYAATEGQLRLIEEKLNAIQAVFPGGCSCVVLDPSGQPLFALPSPVALSATAALPQLSLLKRATLGLSSSCQGSVACPAVHVKGTQRLLSCYDVGCKVLALAVEASSTDIEAFDLGLADAQVAPLLRELQALLDL